MPPNVHAEPCSGVMNDLNEAIFDFLTHAFSTKMTQDPRKHDASMLYGSMTHELFQKVENNLF